MTRQKVTVYRGSFIHAVALDRLEIVERGSVGVNDRGDIIFIEKTGDKCFKESISESKQISGSDYEVEVVEKPVNGTDFFFPGFVDTHIHAPQYPNAGIFGDSTLLDWLNKYTFPVESSFSDLKRARQVYSKVVERTLSNGTTTASYFATRDVEATKVLADEALKQNQRAFIGRVCMTQNTPDYYRDDPEESKKADEEVVEYIKKVDPGYETVCPIVTPRFAPTCDEDMLKWLGSLARRENLPIQTHISENKAEVEWVKELFPRYKSYTDVYDKTGLLTKKTILAHCVHLSEEEQVVIKMRESGVSHCPISNSSLSSGAAPVRKMLDKGIKVSLGTDVSGGFSPSILQVAKQAILVSRHVNMETNDPRDKLSVDEVLALATLGGAQVCDIEDKIGNFETGKKFDAQFVSLVAPGNVDYYDFIADSPEIGDQLKIAVQKWLYCGDDRNTQQVWMNGKLCIDKLE